MRCSVRRENKNVIPQRRRQVVSEWCTYSSSSSHRTIGGGELNDRYENKKKIQDHSRRPRG